jgi:hypothetical protein
VRQTTKFDVPWDELQPGKVLELVTLENGNSTSAMAVMYNTRQIGFITGKLSKTLLAKNEQFRAQVISVTGGGEKTRGCNIEILRQPRASMPPVERSNSLSVVGMRIMMLTLLVLWEIRVTGWAGKFTTLTSVAIGIIGCVLARQFGSTSTEPIRVPSTR